MTYIIDSDKLLNDITFACTVIRVSISWTLKPRLIIHCPVIMDDIYVCHAGEWVKRFPLSQITSKLISKLTVGCCFECLITYFHQIIFLPSWNVWNWQLDNKRIEIIEMRKIRHYYVLSTQHMSLHSFMTHPQAFTILKQDVNIPCIYVTSQPLGNVTWYEIILTIFN